MEMKPLNGCAFQVALSLMNFSLRKYTYWNLPMKPNPHSVDFWWCCLSRLQILSPLHFRKHSAKDGKKAGSKKIGETRVFSASIQGSKSTNAETVNPNDCGASELDWIMQWWMAAFENLIRWKFGLAFKTPFGLGYCWSLKSNNDVHGNGPIFWREMDRMYSSFCLDAWFHQTSILGVGPPGLVHLSACLDRTHWDGSSSIIGNRQDASYIISVWEVIITIIIIIIIIIVLMIIIIIMCQSSGGVISLGDWRTKDGKLLKIVKTLFLFKEFQGASIMMTILILEWMNVVLNWIYPQNPNWTQKDWAIMNLHL